jgi:hypothetical protein
MEKTQELKFWLKVDTKVIKGEDFSMSNPCPEWFL